LEVALGSGEPTIVADLLDVLAAVREAGMVPNVTTNGTVLRAAMIRALAEHAGVVHLSADRPELLDGDRGAGVFHRISRPARRLHTAGARVGANLLLTPGNVGDIRRSPISGRPARERYRAACQGVTCPCSRGLPGH